MCHGMVLSLGLFGVLSWLDGVVVFWKEYDRGSPPSLSPHVGGMCHLCWLFTFPLFCGFKCHWMAENCWSPWNAVGQSLGFPVQSFHPLWAFCAISGVSCKNGRSECCFLVLQNPPTFSATWKAWESWTKHTKSWDFFSVLWPLTPSWS